LPEEPEKDDGPSPVGMRELTTVFVEYTYATYWKGHIKVSFAEYIDGQAYWRTSVVLETNGIRRLIRTLRACLKELGEPEEIQPGDE
jgi:hypothetical protein